MHIEEGEAGESHSKEGDDKVEEEGKDADYVK